MSQPQLPLNHASSGPPSSQLSFRTLSPYLTTATPVDAWDAATTVATNSNAAASLTTATPVDMWDAVTVVATSSNAAVSATATATSSSSSSAASAPDFTAMQSGGNTTSTYIVACGKQPFMLPCPLLANLWSTAPLLTLPWCSHPTFVSPHMVDAEYTNPGVHTGSTISSSSKVLLVRLDADSGSTGNNGDGAGTCPGRAQQQQAAAICHAADSIWRGQPGGAGGAALVAFGNSKGQQSRWEEPVLSEVRVGKTGLPLRRWALAPTTGCAA